MKLKPRIARITDLSCVHLDRDQPVRVEAEGDARERGQRLNKEHAPDHQRKRERHLHRDQDIA
jgi:hypothetical protein